MNNSTTDSASYSANIRALVKNNADRLSNQSLEKYLQPEIVRLIFTFVGGYDYRFIAVVSKTFRTLYSKEFPAKVTSVTLAGLSIHHAKVFYDEYNEDMFPRKRVHDDERKVIKFMMEEAILIGNLDVLKFLVSWEKINVTEMERALAFKFSVGCGRMDCLQFLFTRGVVVHSNVINNAARNGQLHILKFLCQKYSKGYKVLTCESASEGGHIKCLQYLHSKGATFNGRCFVEAARGGHLDCIRYLYENDCTWEIGGQGRADYIMRVAANNSFECFQYLNENQCPWYTWGCFKAAASGGNDECLQYIYNIIRPNFMENRSFHYDLMSEAAGSGRLECLKFLHEKGCGWNIHASRRASSSKSVECLRYLHDNGCPMDQVCCTVAIRNGSINCLRYLHKCGYTLTGKLYTDGLEHYLAAYGTKDAKYLIPCFQYLKEANVETPPATVKQALDKNMSYMLQYFNLNA